MKIKTRHMLLICILLTAFTVRFFWLAKSPPSLNWDEVAHGYNSFSILKTGRDEYGKTLPLAFRSFDDYKSPLYGYLTIIPIYFFGLNELGVRLISVVSGVAVVFLAYLLAKEFFNTKIALLASLLVAIEPWSILFSRATFEANLALAIYLAGIYLLLKSRFRNHLSLAGTGLLGVSTLAYHSAKILILPTLIVFFWAFPKERTKKVFFLSVLLSLVFLAPLLFIPALRLSSTSILKTWNGSLIEFTEGLFARYLAYFSPANIFIRGTPEPTQGLPGFGVLHSFGAPLWLAGIIYLIKNYKKQKLLIGLLAISPIPASITWNWFYPHRVLLTFLLFSIVSAAGGVFLFDRIKKMKSKIIAFLLIFGFAVFALNQIFLLGTRLFFFFPYTQRGAWQYGMKEIVQGLAKVETGYQKIIFETRTAQPYIFVLFYSKFPPDKYQDYSKDILSPRKSFDFEKYEFRDVYLPKDMNLENTLLVGPVSSLPDDKLNTMQNVNYREDVLDFEGNVLARIVGLR